MQITKKELKARAFIPYQITITVESEEEHTNLRKDFEELKNRAESYWYKFQRRLSAAAGLINLILEHKS